MTKKPRVFWTVEEMKVLAIEIIRQRSYTPDISLLDATRRAQVVLPKARQRALKSEWNLVALADFLKSYVPREQYHTPEPPPPAVPPVKEDEVAAAFSNLTRVLAAAVTKEVVGNLEGVVTEFKRELEEVFGNLKLEVHQLQSKPLVTAEITPLRPIVPVPAKPAKPRTKVLIMGLLPAQQHLIEGEYGRDLDLRMIKSNDGMVHRELQEKCRATDVTIGMAKFIKHADDYCAKQHSRQYIPVHGGLTSLRDVLDDIVLRAQEKVG